MLAAIFRLACVSSITIDIPQAYRLPYLWSRIAGGGPTAIALDRPPRIVTYRATASVYVCVFKGGRGLFDTD